MEILIIYNLEDFPTNLELVGTEHVLKQNGFRMICNMHICSMLISYKKLTHGKVCKIRPARLNSFQTGDPVS